MAHVFRQDQHLYFLYEVYDPSRLKSGEAAPAASPGLTRRPTGAVRVLTSIQFMSGGVKVYETPMVEADAINAPERGAVAFQFDVPLTQSETGDLCVPGERDRRCGRELQLSADGADGTGRRPLRFRWRVLRLRLRRWGLWRSKSSLLTGVSVEEEDLGVPSGGTP